MAKCATCATDALYVYQITSDFGITYCQKHLPKFIAKAGTYSTIEPVVAPPVVEVAKVSKKPSEPVPAEPEAPVTDGTN